MQYLAIYSRIPLIKGEGILSASINIASRRSFVFSIITLNYFGVKVGFIGEKTGMRIVLDYYYAMER